MKLIWAWIVLLVVLLSACAQAQTQPTLNTIATEGQPQAPGEASKPPKSGESPAGQDGSAGSDIIIKYQRSGGLQGKTESWTLYRDGRMVTSDGQETKVSEADVQNLQKVIDAAGFFEMQGNYGVMGQCNDCYQYEITVVQNGKQHTVKTVDGAPGVPEGLWEIINLVSSLAASS